MAEKTIFKSVDVDALVDDDGAADAPLWSSELRSTNGGVNGIGQFRGSGFAGTEGRRIGGGRRDGDDVERIFEFQRRHVVGFGRINSGLLRSLRDRL